MTLLPTIERRARLIGDGNNIVAETFEGDRSLQDQG
jgi:hypothetical protein